MFCTLYFTQQKFDLVIDSHLKFGCYYLKSLKTCKISCGISLRYVLAPCHAILLAYHTPMPSEMNHPIHPKEVEFKERSLALAKYGFFEKSPSLYAGYISNRNHRQETRT